MLLRRLPPRRLHRLSRMLIRVHGVCCPLVYPLVLHLSECFNFAVIEKNPAAVVTLFDVYVPFCVGAHKSRTFRAFQSVIHLDLFNIVFYQLTRLIALHVSINCISESSKSSLVCKARLTADVASLTTMTFAGMSRFDHSSS